MGGCASKPKDLDVCQPAPIQSETPEEKVEEQTVPQESINESEVKKEDGEPLVDLSEEAPKAEEALKTEEAQKTEEAPKAEEATPEPIEEVKTEVATKEEEKEAIADEVSEISTAAPKA